MIYAIVQLVFMLCIFGLGVAVGLMWSERIELRREYERNKRYQETFPNNRW